MAETLINSSNDTGGDDLRYLRARQDEVIDTWLHQAEHLPPSRAIGSPPAELAALLPVVLSVALDRAELGDYSHDTDALKPVVDRAVAIGIPLSDVDRAISLLSCVVSEFGSDNFSGVAPSVERSPIERELDEARSEIAHLYLDSIQSRSHDIEEKYLGFMRNAAEALFVCDTENGRILEANRRAEDITGYRTGSLVGMNISQFEESQSAYLISACRQSASERQTVLQENVELTRKDGSTLLADVRISPLYEGPQRGIVLINMHDSTSEVELEERMQLFSEQLNRTANEKAEEVAALTRLTSAISSGVDTEKILQIVVFEIGKLAAFDRLSIMLLEDDGLRFRVMASAGSKSDYLCQGSVLPVENSLLEHVAAQRRSIIIDNLDLDCNFEEDRHLHEEGIKSYISAPLTTGDKFVGSLLLCSSHANTYGQREVRILQDIGEQLAVAMQWAKLREQERRRKAEINIINEVGREAMTTLDLTALLTAACSSIQKNFTFYDVSIYLVDWERGEIRLSAHVGGEPVNERSDTETLRIGTGLVGSSVESGKPVLANRMTCEDKQLAGSELSVPIKIAGRVDGVLRIQCEESNAFDDSSVSALTTLGDLVARAIENARLYQRTSSLRELNENIIATMPSALLVLDQNLTVVLANSAYRKLSENERKVVEGKTIHELWDKQFLEETGLLDDLKECLKTARMFELNNIRHYRGGRQVILNFRMSCIRAGEHPRLLLIMEDVTETVERAFSLSMLREINAAIQGTLELDKILRLVLTCITAGHALGFNRGFLLMVNKDRQRIEGTTGIGPVNLEDARNIYSDEGLRRKSLRQLLRECDFSVNKKELPLYHLARKMVIPLKDEDEIIVKTVKDKQAHLVLDAVNDERVSPRFREMLGSNSFVIVPLVAKDEVIGVIVADNLYSGHPITMERVELLCLFANHAGLAIENGASYAQLQAEVEERKEAYKRLEEMKEREVRTCQLAAVGEMAARVAHEIRNPLATIGGYARSVLRTLDTSDPNHKKTDVIVGEVTRLERILTDVVDFSKPAAPNKTEVDLSKIIHQIGEFLKPQLTERNIQFEHQVGDLPIIPADPSQVKQALFNIVKNAMEAIDSDGTIKVAAKVDKEMVVIDVIDSGPGIMEDVRTSMYNLFYTTKNGGTGLGLAITRKIIEDHRGLLNVDSILGEGTTFSVHLPINGGDEDVQFNQAPMQGGPQP